MNLAKLAFTICITFLLVFLSFPLALESEHKVQDTDQHVVVRLIWERSFPDGILDVAFDEDREGVFCPSIVVEGEPAWSKAILFLDGNGDEYKKIELAQWSLVRVSPNGRYIGVMRRKAYEKQFQCGPVDILDTAGVFVRRFKEGCGHVWLVSPTGKEIACWDGFSDDLLIYFTGINGKRSVNLSKWEGDVILFDSMPAAKWKDIDNGYLHIGGLLQIDGYLRGPNGIVFCSPDGKYVALSKYFPSDSGSVAHLVLYTHDGIPLRDFDLAVSRSLFASFSDDGRYLVAAVKNLVFLIDVTDRKVLWEYESDDQYQVLNRPGTIDFCPEPFYIAGVFHHKSSPVYGERDERLIIFSANGEVIADTLITETVDPAGDVVLRVSRAGDMICYVTEQRIRVFQVRITE
jgi:hypothetical protein